MACEQAQSTVDDAELLAIHTTATATAITAAATDAAATWTAAMTAAGLDAIAHTLPGPSIRQLVDISRAAADLAMSLTSVARSAAHLANAFPDHGGVSPAVTEVSAMAASATALAANTATASLISLASTASREAAATGAWRISLIRSPASNDTEAGVDGQPSDPFKDHLVEIAAAMEETAVRSLNATNTSRIPVDAASVAQHLRDAQSSLQYTRCEIPRPVSIRGMLGEDLWGTDNEHVHPEIESRKTSSLDAPPSVVRTSPRRSRSIPRKVRFEPRPSRAASRAASSALRSMFKDGTA